MLTDEQLKVRARGIFATDIARIMTGHGVQVTLEKMGEIEREDIGDLPTVRLGNILEAPVLQAFSALTGLACEPSPRTQMHPTIAWLGAHPDALGQEGADLFTVECKAWSPIARQQFGEAGTDEVPDYVLWQAQAQLAVTGGAKTYVPACFTTPENMIKYVTRGEVEIELFCVQRSDALIERLIAQGELVWDCIQEGRLPEPVNIGDAVLLYRRDKGTAINASHEIAVAHRRLMQIRPELKRLTVEHDALKDAIQRYMGEAAELYEDGRLLATWKKARDGMRFDEDAFAKVQPELYAKFMKQTIGSRRFLPKAD